MIIIHIYSYICILSSCLGYIGRSCLLRIRIKLLTCLLFVSWEKNQSIGILLVGFIFYAVCTFFISCCMASHHNMSPFSLSVSMASLTRYRMRSPYLCVFCQYFSVLDMILSLFLSIFFIQN